MVIENNSANDIRITFGIIVLNGEPFTSYNLRSLYSFAHEIIVVEGACPSAASFATPDGHSNDGTLETVREFQRLHDPEKKLRLVTAEEEGHQNGFWTEKDEMSQAYAKRATGNYLWQIDMDEFYRAEDMQNVIETLHTDPSIQAITFRQIPFWGGLDYYADGIRLRRGEGDFHRLFAWRPGYRYVTHRPPTVVDETGQDLRTIHALSAAQMASRGIYMYHYTFVFPFQVDFKLAYYSDMDKKAGNTLLPQRQAWRQNYYDLKNPFLIDDTSVIGEASWLRRFRGKHPEMITALFHDIDQGKLDIKKRPTEDIERLIHKPGYQIVQSLLPLFGTLSGRIRGRVQFLKRAVRYVGRIAKNAGPELRTILLSVPVISTQARKNWSLQSVAASHRALREKARQAQFANWYPEDVNPKIDWYGRHGWTTLDKATPAPLVVVSREFFQKHTAESAKSALRAAFAALKPGETMLIYAPHWFAFADASEFSWVPNWQDLHELAESTNSLRILDFNPGFDRNGFFDMVVEKQAITQAPSSQVKFHKVQYFYMHAGEKKTLGHSAQVLSACGFHVMQQFSTQFSDEMYSYVPNERTFQSNDIAIGHYGTWITQARKSEALTVLYGPCDRFRKERHDEQFYLDLQTHGTFDEQYQAAHMLILQGGGCWRMIDAYTYPGLCRWIDLPIFEAVFPRTKKILAPAGKRVFCFINLYNEASKGAKEARRIAERCPDIQFIAIRCPAFNLPNVIEHSGADNRSAAFRQIVTQADFLITPAWEDPQPGTVAECSALGLVPILSEYAGYVLSFPNRIDLNDLDQCAQTLRDAQSASDEEVLGWQALNAQYIEEFHRVDRFNILFSLYIQEAYRDYCRMTAKDSLDASATR